MSQTDEFTQTIVILYDTSLVILYKNRMIYNLLLYYFDDVRFIYPHYFIIIIIIFPVTSKIDRNQNRTSIMNNNYRLKIYEIGYYC